MCDTCGGGETGEEHGQECGAGPQHGSGHRVGSVEDIGPDTQWRDVLDGVTSVVHLAGIARQLGTAAKSAEAEMERVNVGRTKQLAESMACSPSVVRMVLVSSIGVYGDQLEAVVSERTPCRPNTHYGRTKLASEHIVRGALEDSGASGCIVRTVGLRTRKPRQHGETSPQRTSFAP